MDDKVKKCLQQAICVIRTKGWDKGQRENYHGEVCLLGAIDRTRFSTRTKYLAKVKLASTMTNPILARLWYGPTIAHWNDNECGYKARAMQRLEKALKSG